jgi:hypothetical protein
VRIVVIFAPFQISSDSATQLPLGEIEVVAIRTTGVDTLVGIDVGTLVVAVGDVEGGTAVG